MDSSSESEEGFYVLETNALLIDIIVERLMEFLSLKNLKNCRLVCQKWNYISDPMLKKRGKVVFTADSRPSAFLANFSQPDHLSRPFTSFVWVINAYYSSHAQDQRWTLYEVHEFFIKWGKYVKSLELWIQAVWVNRNDRRPIQRLNIDSLIQLMGNLETLTLVGNYVGIGESLEVSLHKLRSIRNISLNTVYAILDCEENRIAPSKIKLVDIFFRRNGNTVQDTSINDFVDFSHCSDIKIEQVHRLLGRMRYTTTFDFSRDVVNCNEIDFERILSLNVGTSKTKTDRLLVNNSPIEAVQIHVKELQVRNCIFDLTLIPTTVEKVTITNCVADSLENPPLDLPNLRFLSVSPLLNGETSDLDVYKMIPLFANCRNLFDLELTPLALGHFYNVKMELDVSRLPKSVKVLKLGREHGISFVPSDPMEVDVLILVEDGAGDFENNRTKVLEQIKTKILIRAHFCPFSSDAPNKESVSKYIADIVRDKKLVEIIAQLQHGPHTLQSLELVDRSKSSDSADKGSSVLHEFIGQFLVIEEHREEFLPYTWPAPE